MSVLLSSLLFSSLLFSALVLLFFSSLHLPSLSSSFLVSSLLFFLLSSSLVRHRIVKGDDDVPMSSGVTKMLSHGALGVSDAGSTQL